MAKLAKYGLIVGLLNLLNAEFIKNDELLYEYKFMVNREELKEKERIIGNKLEQLSEDEEIVKNYLQHLKQLEYELTKNRFLPAQPLELVLDDIKSSKVYKVLKQFPKGGNMHNHHEVCLSMSRLLDLIINSPLYENLYLKREDPLWRLDLFTTPPQGWERVINNQPKYSKTEILNHITLLNIFKNLNTSCQLLDSDRIWKIFGPMLSLASDQLTNHVDLSGLYMEAIMKASLEQNVQYIESRSRSYKKIYTLDNSSKYEQSNGKRVLDTENGELELNIIDKNIKQFTTENPNFIGYKRIVESYRHVNKAFVYHDMERAYYLYRKYPNLVTGFDISNVEDNGYSNIYFLEKFAAFAAEKKFVPYYFHAGESIWPGDVMTSQFDDDLVAAEENVLDSLVFATKRVGHGLSLAKKPFLLHIMKERGIAVEICPASEMMLGYVRDQRSHPGILYLRYGVPVVLGSDGAGVLGYDDFTVDWYYVFMAWGVDLIDLKQLATNSLEYSAMSIFEKKVAFQKWHSAWDQFIQDIKQEACSMHSISNTNVNPKINAILPRGGPENGGHYVYIFGRNFQIGICRRILCKFGDMYESCQYIADHIIRCDAPKRCPSCKHDILSVAVSFDGGSVYLKTPQNYTFLSAQSEENFDKYGPLYD